MRFQGLGQMNLSAMYFYAGDPVEVRVEVAPFDAQHKL